MRPFNKKFSVFDPNLQIGADTKKTADGDNNIQKAEFEQVIRSSGQTPGASISITSLTQTAGLATAVTAAPHGFINGQWVDIFGVDADPYQLLVYNGIQQATVTAPDTFTFPILPGTPSPATGTIGVYHSQIDKAIANYAASQFSWKEAAGSAADVYVLERVGITTLAVPDAFYEGAIFQFEVVNTNTGASTMEIPVLGIKDIKIPGGLVLKAGDLSTGRMATLRYDGTELILINYTVHDTIPDFPNPHTANGTPAYSVVADTELGFVATGRPIQVSLRVGKFTVQSGNSILIGVDEFNSSPLVPLSFGLSLANPLVGPITQSGILWLSDVVFLPPGSRALRVIIKDTGTGTSGNALYNMSFWAYEI